MLNARKTCPRLTMPRPPETSLHALRPNPFRRALTSTLAPTHPSTKDIPLLELAENPAAVAGHNLPPEPTPFEQSKTEIEDLFLEAKNWLDGEPVQTQEQADAVARLMTELRAAVKRADERRIAENKPFDEGKAAVQQRYNPLIQKDRGKADIAIATCKQALVPFLAREEAERAARADALRREADERQEAARDAMRASHMNLADREIAEWLLLDAHAAGRRATKEEKTKSAARGGGRAISMRTRYRAAITDRREVARFMWVTCPEQFDALLLRLAQAFVDAGRRTIPGIEVLEERSAQ